MDFGLRPRLVLASVPVWFFIWTFISLTAINQSMPQIKSNGIKLYYETFGKGEPLLMIMGMAIDHNGWKKQIEFFRDKYKVIVFDNRGSGKSDKPITPYTTQQMADDTLGLLDHLKIDKANIMGISLGGMIAQTLAIKGSNRVKKLVIANSYSNPIPTIKEFVWKNFSPSIISKLAKGELVDHFLSFVLSEDFRKNHPDKFQSIKETHTNDVSKIGIVNQLLATQLHNTTNILVLIDKPALVLYGSEDLLIPAQCSQTIHEGIRNSEIQCIEKGSHSVNWEKPDEFNKRVFDFLKR